MKKEREEFRKLLRQIRLACGYSQGAVAEALGVNRSTYTCYELGKTVPSLDTLKKLSLIFAVPIEAFLFPETFQGLETTRQRSPRRVQTSPERIGELSEEEKTLIARFRAEGEQ